MKTLLPIHQVLRRASPHWFFAADGLQEGLDIFQRHYTFSRKSQQLNYRLFVGPGEKLVLIGPHGKSLFVWRKFISRAEEGGINCAVFRNESRVLSSTLILEAEKIAWDRWPKERLYTYVNAEKIQSSNPGFCFQAAGWKKIGVTKIHKLVILEKRYGTV